MPKRFTRVKGTVTVASGAGSATIPSESDDRTPLNGTLFAIILYASAGGSLDAASDVTISGSVDGINYLTDLTVALNATTKIYYYPRQFVTDPDDGSEASTIRTELPVTDERLTVTVANAVGAGTLNCDFIMQLQPNT